LNMGKKRKAGRDHKNHAKLRSCTQQQVSSLCVSADQCQLADWEETIL
jgi:hypothetical protein